MASFKEIVTKAIIGKGKKTFITNHSVEPLSNVNTILGCWIINHNFHGKKLGEAIKIDGSYDVNIWYSSLGDTKTEVVMQKNTYSETVNVRRNNNADTSDEEVIVRGLKQPNCVKAEVINGVINYTIEKELGIEIVGDTKIKIAIDENEEPWEEIESVSEDEINSIDNEINDEF